MIEDKLYQASLNLPEPTSSFSQIEEKAYFSKRNRPFYTRRYRMAVAVFACVFLLLGGVVAAATTEVNYSAWATRSNAFSDVNIIAATLGVVLPETLGDSPFYNITTMHVAPEGTTYLDAVTNPAYPWYSVDYGVQHVERVYHSDSPDSSFSESTVIYDQYSVSFGSCEHELFRYVFSLDTSGNRILENALPGSYRIEDYHGIRMQMFTDVQYDSNHGSEVFAYHHRVIWVDTNENVVFSLHKSSQADENMADLFPNEMITFAKAMIDMNL